MTIDGVYSPVTMPHKLSELMAGLNEMLRDKRLLIITYETDNAPNSLMHHTFATLHADGVRVVRDQLYIPVGAGIDIPLRSITLGEETYEPIIEVTFSFIAITVPYYYYMGSPDRVEAHVYSIAVRGDLT